MINGPRVAAARRIGLRLLAQLAEGRASARSVLCVYRRNHGGDGSGSSVSSDRLNGASEAIHDRLPSMAVGHGQLVGRRGGVVVRIGGSRAIWRGNGARP